jgi:PAS domain S-box-containing protein
MVERSGESNPGGMAAPPSPECFRALIERSRDAVVLLAADATVRYVSSPTVPILGYTPEEFIGRNALELVHPDDLPRISAIFAQLLASPGGSRTALYRYRHKDGSWRWLEGTGTNLLDDPAVRAVAAYYRDITRQREAEQAQAELAAIVASSEDAIVGKDLDGVITSWNGGAERLYGYAAAEVVGRPMTVLMPADRPDELPGILERLRRGERIDPYETVRRRKDGGLVQVSVSISPIKDAAGQIVGAAAIARDIGGQKRLEAELRRQAEQLAEADRRKTEFLNVLAHELRNPLAPILNALHILGHAATDPHSHEQARGILDRQTRHLARLVDDLLDVSRISRGKAQLRRERLDLARLVRTTAEDHRATVGRAGLALVVDVPETPVWVIGDTTRLAQVLTNLLDNAAKFTGRGGRVEVRLAADRPRRQAALHVRDTGAGLEPGLIPQLFEPFSQADQGLERPHGGLGLGLALVKGLAELHGGTAEAHSGGPGRGSEFVVRLPTEGEPAALSGMPAAPPRGGKRRRILIIEDNQDAAFSLGVLLELLGHEVRMVHSGPEGVEAAREWRPDIVLSDIGLPGLDGFGVAQELRRDPNTAGVRLIAITGYGSDDDRRRAREAGFDHLLTKPADPEVLRQLLVNNAA